MEDKSCLKIFLGGFKIQNSLSKVEKCQNILRITKLENVEKIHRDHVLEAQMVSIHYMAVLFCSTQLCCKNLLGGGIRGVKMFLDGFKIQHLHSKVEKCQHMCLVSVDATRYIIFRLLNVNDGF